MFNGDFIRTSTYIYIYIYIYIYTYINKNKVITRKIYDKREREKKRIEK